MATVKVKNAAGEWVDAIASESYERKAANFKMVWVERSADGLSYDLSPYLYDVDDFMLCFTYGATTYGRSYVWMGSEGKARLVDGDNIYVSNSNMANHSPLDMICDSEHNTSSFNYDKTSRTFTFVSPGTTGAKLSEVAALIYAG